MDTKLIFFKSNNFKTKLNFNVLQIVGKGICKITGGFLSLAYTTDLN